MPLEQIPVVDASGADFLTGNGPAVLREILARLEHLVAEGEPAIIDLLGLPFSPADRAWLRRQLGDGEVRIGIDAGGPSRLIETAFPGVWWVEHRNALDELVGTFIEIAWVPDLVAVSAEDAAAGAAGLKNLISGLS